MTAPWVVAVIATYRRPAELARLLHSLEQIRSGLKRVIVMDNADAPEVRQVVEATSLATDYISTVGNLGCGGGLRLAEKTALERFPELTHIWILDDDAVVKPNTLDVLLTAMEREHADVAHPLTESRDGYLSWFPGLLDAEKFRAIRRKQTADEFIARCGDEPVAFSWSQGIALLVTRRGLDELGFHRSDYWVRGEDLEFSLRLTHRFRGIYVPAARVQHLPPESAGPQSQEIEYSKHRAMLQNLAYTAIRLRHGRRLVRTLPGNWLRFVRIWGKRPYVLADILKTLLRGALLGQPAGFRGSPDR